MPPLHSVQIVSDILFNLRQKRSLQLVLRACVQLHSHGLDTHQSLGNELVFTLVGVDLSISYAQLVFNRLPYREPGIWNTLITGYVLSGQFHLAFRQYEQMEQENFTHVAILTWLKLVQACSELKDLQQGQKLHAKLLKLGLPQKDLYIGSALVEFYAKFGYLFKARAVFDELAYRDVVLWTTLIEAYAEKGQGDEALNFFEAMQEEGISPDEVAFVCSLKACAGLRSAAVGKGLHFHIILKGLESNSLVGNTLVDMYIKCDLLVQAREVFDKLPVRGVVTWNILIMGYVEHGYGELALDCFKQMQQEGISPDELSFMSSFRACSATQKADSGQDLHLFFVKLGLEGDLFVSNTIVDMYAKCGFLAEAQAVFDTLLLRDEVSWNALLFGYAYHGCGKEALECFEQVRQESLLPHIAMFICGLKACGSLKAKKNGQELYTDIIVRELEGDTTLCNTLIYMYASCDSLPEAEYVFDNIAVKSDVSWNTMILGYWDQGHSEEALECYKEMQKNRLNPGSVTSVCSLKACGSIGAVYKGQEIHTQATLQGIERELFVGNTLVDMYAKCGCLQEAQEVFDNLALRDNISWNALLTGWAQLGESETVFEVFKRMLEAEIDPDFFTFVNILNVCCHAGLIEEGQRVFYAMCYEFGVLSTSEHHSCMVNLFGRAGCVIEAVAIMNRMPCHPNLLAWNTMLGACQKWGNVALGRTAFEHALQLDDTDTTAYFCMCNIYSGNLEVELT